MAKQQEPVIRQTPDGPMREIREVFPTAWYAAGGFCLLYACVFPLYRLHHFLICAGLACAAAFFAQKLTPERIRLEPYQAPLTGDERVDEILTRGQDAIHRLRSANDVLADATARVQPPSDKGKRLKIYYMTQASVKPPTFVFFCNNAELFHFSYQRYLENCLRETFGFTGTPIKLIIRERGEDNDK